MSRLLYQSRRVIRVLLGLAAGVAGVPARAADADQPSPENRQYGPGIPLTRVADVKAWAELAGESLPVEIEGVVTCGSPAGNFFLHDGEVGIHVGATAAGRRLAPGDRVRVVGVTRRGSFAPSLEPRELVSLGRGALPVPRHATYHEVASGTLDGQWLEIDGVVCDLGTENTGPGAVLWLGIDGRRLRVTLNSPLLPDTFLDAEVRIQGVASGSFNTRRQLVEPVLRVPGPGFVEVLRPPPANPFALPAVPLSRLLGFSPEAPSPHRVRIRGVVTRSASENVLFVREENLGLQVQTRAPVAHRPGNVVEAVGFPTMAGGSAILEGASTRVVDTRPAPAPVRPTWPRLLDGSHSADLVTVAGRLVDHVAAAGALTLILEADRHLFRAMLPAAASEAVPERGSVVEATGICIMGDVEDGWSETGRPFRLLLSGPADLVVTQRPGWWTPSRLGRALAAVLVLLLAGLGWVWSLRREVRRKHAVIEQQARHAAVLEERTRIARDLHDTLEQGLTGLSLQLKVVEIDARDAPPQVPGGLERARQMLRHSRALAHDAIRELRTDDVSRRHETLRDGLERIAETWRHSGIPAVTVAIRGTECPLAAATSRQLLGIAAEAITNAIKHGQATTIGVAVDFHREGVRLRIDDNGTGFDLKRAGAAASAGFGLVGMRERAESIGAALRIDRHAAGGTSVAVDVPYPAAVDGAGRPAAAPPASTPSTA